MQKHNTLSAFFDTAVANDQKKHTLILDGHNLIFRNIATATFIAATEEEKRSKAGRVVEGADVYDYWKYLMVNSLFTCIRQFRPDHVIIALDSRQSWRKKIYPEYKANRAAMRESSKIDFAKFFPVVTEFMQQLASVFQNVCVVEVESCEADDIAAVATKNLFGDGDKHRVTLVTTDKDYRQLLTLKHVSIYQPLKKKLVECLNPTRELEISFIMGDKVDNIPAIQKKCGPKTAAKILDSGLEVALSSPVTKKAYQRNQALIDFNRIPKPIVQKIEQALRSYPFGTATPASILSFLIKNNVHYFVEELQSYLPYLQKVQSYV